MKVKYLAALLAAQAEGDEETDLIGGAPPESAGPHELAFIESREAASRAAESQAGCLLLAADAEAPAGRTVIRVKQPRNAFAKAIKAIVKKNRPPIGIHPTAVVHATVRMAPAVAIGPNAVIAADVELGDRTVIQAGAYVGEGSKLGADCWVYPNATIYHGVTIGNRAILHSGCVVGADGFGFVFEGDHYEKFPQIGGVRIGDDVEIGANACVDRGALGDTILESGVKLDNLVHVGHNCRIGKHVVMAAQCGLSGGVVMEDYVIAGGQVGISEKAHIEAKAVLGAQCGILPHKRLTGGQTYWGTPARIHREHLKKLALVERLPKLQAELESLKKQVAELTSK